MRRKIIFFLILLITGCQAASKEKQPKTGPLISVNRDQISYEEFMTSYRLTLSQMPDQADRTRIKEALTQQLIQDKLLLQEAKRRKVDESDHYRETLWLFRTRDLGNALRDTIFNMKFNIRRDEILNKLPKIEKQITVREIVVESKALADSLLGELQTGSDFRELARTFSISPTSKEGGLVGEVRPSDRNFPKLYINETMMMEEGDISETIEINGVFVILRTDRVYPPPDLERRRVRLIRDQLVKERQATFYRTLRDSLLAQTRVVNYPDKLDSAHSLSDTAIVAVVHEDRITYGLLKRFKNSDKKWSFIKDSVKANKEVLDSILESALFRMEAERRGYDKEQNFAKRLHIQQEYALKRGLIQAVTGDTHIPNEEVRRFYDEHIDSYQAHKQRLLRQIVVQTRSRADSLADQIQQGDDFGILAQLYSIDDKTSGMGGNMGYVGKKQLDPALADAAFSLEINQVGGAIQTEQGFHLLQPLAERETPDVSFEQASPKIRLTLKNMQGNEKMKAISKELRAIAAIEINEKLMAKID
ncbi:MAG: hypothetical protein B6244_10920 [Candidatus Cloacimonetes bacterium 4572_55]|nr:MAG: hypothetical protein B6244_10920 [Candidatus Cloacimonetes bacterium 4572_55]